MIATERLFLTADDRVVSEGDPDAAFLLCIPGEEIPEGIATPKPLAIEEAKPEDVVEPAVELEPETVESDATPKKTRARKATAQ